MRQNTTTDPSGNCCSTCSLHFTFITEQTLRRDTFLQTLAGPVYIPSYDMPMVQVYFTTRSRPRFARRSSGARRRFMVIGCCRLWWSPCRRRAATCTRMPRTIGLLRRPCPRRSAMSAGAPRPCMRGRVEPTSLEELIKALFLFFALVVY